MRKSKLVVDYKLGAEVIGLVTSLKDYKLAWSINQAFKINLVMQPNLLIEFIKGKNLSVVNFKYQTESQQIRLVKNKGIEENSGYLIRELANFDFFLMINDEDDILPAGKLESLNDIKDIVYLKKIEVVKLKSKDNFIF